MPCERTDNRIGYDNSLKQKTVNRSIGKLQLRVAQTRDVEFYPSMLECGERRHGLQRTRRFFLKVCSAILEEI